MKQKPPPILDVSSTLLNECDVTNQLYGAVTSSKSQLPIPKSSINGAAMNMLNVLIGSGILGIPYVYSQTGIIGSIILMIIFGIIDVYTLNLLIISGKKLGVNNYEDLMEQCFGITGYMLCSICIAMYDFGSIIAYLIIIGDGMIKILSIWNYNTLFDRQIIILSISLMIIFPLCLFRDLSSLEQASRIKIFAIILVILVIFVQFSNINHNISDSIGSDTSITLFGDIQSIPFSIGIVAFAFVCHDSTFLIYNTLSNPIQWRYFKLSVYGVFGSMCFTLLLSIPAYLTFGNSVQSNILNNYDIHSALTISMRIIYVISMCIAYPANFFLVRHIVYGWYQKLQCVYSTNYANDSQPYIVQTAPLWHHVIFSFSIFAVSVVIALYVDNLGSVMSIIGLFACVNLGFVFPPLCYMKIQLKSTKYIALIIPFIISIMGISLGICGIIQCL